MLKGPIHKDLKILNLHLIKELSGYMNKKIGRTKGKKSLQS